MYVSRFIAAILGYLIYSNLLFAQDVTRKADDEAICQPFLTSPISSPLSNSPRDIPLDEEGEWACLQVLNDINLPLQIRVTIHEGLFYLGVRHVSMGLPVHHMISYHLNSLTQILPNVAKFHIKAGEWSLDPHTSNYEKAKQYFENVYNGSASTDNKLTDYDVYTVKREYARVLNILGYYEDAIHIYKSILKKYPLDLGVGFLLRDSVHALASSRDDVDTCDSLDSNPELQEYLKQGQDFNRLVVSSSVDRNEYKGFIPGSNWQPKRFNHMLTPEEFQGFIERREPFVISFGSINNIDASFGWSTGRWLNDSYLHHRVSANQKVQVEYQSQTTPTSSKSSSCARLMGYGATNRRKVLMFHEFLTGGSYIGTNTNDPSKTSRTMSYLNVQSDGLRQDVNKYLHADKSEGGGDIDQLSAPVYYSPPLHSLFSDIALPNMLQPIESDLSNVNIWMNSHSSVNPESSITGSVLNYASNLFSPSSEKSIDRMTSRMHMDATDNLYVLLQGDKTFNLVDPSQAMLMETVMPTYAVAANGLSFRYNPVKYPIFETENLAPPASSVDISSGHFSTIADVTQRGDLKLASVKLSAGDILYLPTGWFHQVTSSGDRHLAINYWWKPPGWRDMVEFERRAAENLVSSVKTKISEKKRETYSEL